MAISSANGSNSLQVLVVEDEVLVRDDITQCLRDCGCTVFEADTGEQAIAMCEAGVAVDVVFTDIGMPDMSGWELASEIRKRSGTVPLAIVSGWADAISCDARQAIKADWVVPKPFDIAIIAGIANEVAERKKNPIKATAELANRDVRKLIGMA